VLVLSLVGGVDPGDRRAGRIEESDLHEDGGLIPVDVLVVELVASEVDGGDQWHLDVAAGRGSPMTGGSWTAG
jgi:hypothetical protein